MRRIKFIRQQLSIVCLGIMWMGIVSAQTPNVGDQVTATQSIPLRAAPPQNLYLVIKGEQVGLIQPGEQVTIEQTETVSSLLRTDIWVKVRRSKPESKPRSGWAFFGTEGHGTNFKPEG